MSGGGNGPPALCGGGGCHAPALEAVAEGTLQGTVLNDAQGQAREMLDLACDLAEGTAPQVEDGHYVWLEYSAVTRRRWKRHPPERKAKGNKDTGPGTHCVPGPVLCVYERKPGDRPRPESRLFRTGQS